MLRRMTKGATTVGAEPCTTEIGADWDVEDVDDVGAGKDEELRAALHALLDFDVK